MCYGDIDHGRDDYYRDYVERCAERQAEEEREQKEQENRNENEHTIFTKNMNRRVFPENGILFWTKANFPETKIVDELKFSNAFIDFLDDMHDKGIMRPNKDFKGYKIEIDGKFIEINDDQKEN